jgi:glucokinase
MILAGDIGGTNTRVALFEGSADRLTPVAVEVFPSPAHRSLEEILGKFRAQHSEAVDAAAFGIAGPVFNGRCETPNLAWVVDRAVVAGALGVEPVSLINDLEANAHGISVLEQSDFSILSEGSSEGSAGARGNRVLISAGTGLGQAGMIAEGGGYRPYASEGGHADFAPRNEIEIELLRYLLQRFEHVSYERVLSGPGLRNIYQFYRDTGRAEEPAWLAEEMKNRDSSAVISQNAMKASSELCVLALDHFVSLYGAEAGNLALKGMATGGVYVGGGIAPKILPKLREPQFLESFWAKGRVSKVLRAMPVRVILNDRTALYGAGRVAMISRGRSGAAERGSA